MLESDRKSLSDEYAGVQTFGVRRSYGWPEVTRLLDPERLAGILSDAREGRADSYLTLAEEMEERDLHYRSVLSTRKAAVEGLQPTVKPAGDDQASLDIAAAVQTHIVERPDMTDIIKDSLDALGKGYAVHEILWDTASTPWRPGEIVWRDPRWFAYDSGSGRTLGLKSGDTIIPLLPRKFIVHEPHLKSGLPIRGGLAMAAAFYFLIKYYDITSWAAFVDRYGYPIRLGKYDKRATDEDIETLKSAIAHIGEDVGAVIPESMQVDIIEAKMTGSTALYEKMADWMDRQVSKLVLGQTMTADAGSSRSQAEVHDDVRQDILEADARQLEKTLNRDLVKPFIDLNYGPQERYPALMIPTPDTTDISAWVENIGKLVPLGLRVKADEVRGKLGLSRPEDGDEVLEGPSGAGGSGMPAGERNTLERDALELNAVRSKKRGAERDELDELAEDAEYAAITDDILTAVNSLAERCSDLDDFGRRLPELLELWDMEAAADHLTEATWKARALGDGHFNG